MIVKDKIVGVIDWGLAVYDKVLERALGMKFLNTYEQSPDDVVRQLCIKNFQLSQEEAQRAVGQSICAVVGVERANMEATRLIRMRALRCALVTALCSLPDNWLTWVLLVVDIVFFQLQIFCITQELFLIYLPHDRREAISFDYATLAQAAVRMQGTMMRQKVIHWSKKIAGIVGKFIIHGKGRVVSIVSRQVLKWTGIVVTQKNLEVAMSWVMAFACALVDGLVSYWLFVPMARRQQRRMREMAVVVEKPDAVVD